MRRHEVRTERHGQIGLHRNKDRSFFEPVPDSLRDFKYSFFFVGPLNDAARKEVARFNERGEVVEHLFPTSWSREHFKFGTKDFSCQESGLSPQEARTVRRLACWVKCFTTSLKKIEFEKVLEAGAESAASLRAILVKTGLFLY